MAWVSRWWNEIMVGTTDKGHMPPIYRPRRVHHVVSNKQRAWTVELAHDRCIAENAFWTCWTLYTESLGVLTRSSDDFNIQIGVVRLTQLIGHNPVRTPDPYSGILRVTEPNHG